MIAIFDPQKKGAPGLVLITEDDFAPVLLDTLEQAKKQIDLMAFSFITGNEKGVLFFRSGPFKIMETLKRLKKKNGRKLRVRAYLEGTRDTATKNKVTGEHLTKGGVEVRYGNTHVKCFCIDGRYLVLGSSNLTDQSLNRNFETNLLIDSPAIAKQFTSYFNHCWKGGAMNKVTLKSPLIADGAFKVELLRLIRRAKKKISFSIYFFFQKEIEDELISAHERGVVITGLVHDHKTFGLDDVRRTKKTISRLREAGVERIQYSSAAIFTHSKYLICDEREALVGTGNWIDRDVTTYPQLYLHVQDARLCKRLAKHLKTQMEK